MKTKELLTHAFVAQFTFVLSRFFPDLRKGNSLKITLATRPSGYFSDACEKDYRTWVQSPGHASLAQSFFFNQRPKRIAMSQWVTAVDEDRQVNRKRKLSEKSGGHGRSSALTQHGGVRPQRAQAAILTQSAHLSSDIRVSDWLMKLAAKPTTVKKHGTRSNR